MDKTSASTNLGKVIPFAGDKILAPLEEIIIGNVPN
jgi:hypothetical protein